MPKVFLDTNILLYSMDKHDPVKRDACRGRLRWLEESGHGVISTQVMQEFYVAATGKLGVEHEAAKSILRSLENYEVVLVDPPLIREAADCRVSSRLSFWDALIVVSARQAACDKIWTEDMNAGQTIEGVLIENPMASPKSVL
ncbi:MAG: PIN domain-containing protein [Candidatus Sumerlaeota bacterium]|nr:PIN domain-containing protein [Candidatus Sumerlaeota bacterium]